MYGYQFSFSQRHIPTQKCLELHIIPLINTLWGVIKFVTRCNAFFLHFILINITPQDSPITGMTIIMVSSTLTAMTALNMMYTGSIQTLTKFNIQPKFRIIKAGLIFGNLQLAVYRILGNYWFLPCFLQLPYEIRAGCEYRNWTRCGLLAIGMGWLVGGSVFRRDGWIRSGREVGRLECRLLEWL